jgi:hypothetical protein
MGEVTVHKSGKSAAFFLWFFVIDSLLLKRKALKGGLQLLLPLENLSHQLVEGALGPFECFRTRLHIDYADLLGHLRRLSLVHFPLVLEVVLIANQQQVDLGHVSLLVDLLDPKVDHFEGLLVGDVKDQQDAINVAVVVGRDGVVSRGAGSVPDLDSDGVTVLQFKDLLLVLHSNGGGMVHTELLIHVLRQERTLTHVALPNYQHFYAHLILSAHTPII